MVRDYADVKRKLIVPKIGGRNWPNTATFMTMTIKHMSNWVGGVVGATLGAVTMPGLPWRGYWCWCSEGGW